MSTPDSRPSRIGMADGLSERGRGRGRGGRGRGRGRGRGHGRFGRRSGRGYQPYQMPQDFGNNSNFTAQAKNKHLMNGNICLCKLNNRLLL